MFGRRQYMPRGGGFPGRGRNNGMIMVLLMQIFAQVQQLERKPPVTIALIGAMAALFMYAGAPGVPTSRKFALCPNLIVDRFDWQRLIVSAFLHVDEWHLYNNMISLLWKGVNLEFKFGSEKFAQMIAILLLLSNVLTVLAAYTISVFLSDWTYYRQCSVGFSGVLFALKMILNQNSPANSTILGFSVPTRYAAWFELVYIHLFVPRSSFLGHLSGILAGYLYLKFPMWFPLHGQRHTQEMPTQPRYTYASGTSTRAPQPTSYESDEAYARRLQEEEYRRR